jgi:hypothetical protein
MMKKNSYEERAKRFIAQIFPYLDECYDHEEREYAVAQFNEDYHRKVFYTHGMSRYALVTSDYVVKVDYQATRWGNCEDEMELYEEAERDGFAYLFAKISRYDYEGVSFYIMPRIYGIGRFFYDADEYLTAEESDWCWDHVRDLHNENYGWKNGHVIIFDYAARA